MPYLRVDCYTCHIHWNYYEEKYEVYPQTTGVPLQGCVCPRCGSIGFIAAGPRGRAEVSSPGS